MSTACQFHKFSLRCIKMFTTNNLHRIAFKCQKIHILHSPLSFRFNQSCSRSTWRGTCDQKKEAMKLVVFSIALWQCRWLPLCSSSTDRPLIRSSMAKLIKPRTEMPVITHFEWQVDLLHFRWFNIAQLCKQIDLTRVNARRKWHDIYHKPSWSSSLQSRTRTSAGQYNIIKNLGCRMR